MHRDFMAQGHVTPDGLKTFLEMGKLYEFCGGDDIYHEKLLPEVKALEVKYTEESIQKNKQLQGNQINFWLPYFLRFIY